MADGDAFSKSLAPLGDLNGDGRLDLAVGAEKDDTGGTNRGAVYVLFDIPVAVPGDFNVDGALSQPWVAAGDRGFFAWACAVPVSVSPMSE